MSKIIKGIKLELSCYCCGETVFENSTQDWNEVEGMYFLQDEKSILKCINCGLEDRVANLVPRGRNHEELREGNNNS